MGVEQGKLQISLYELFVYSLGASSETRWKCKGKKAREMWGLVHRGHKMSGDEEKTLRSLWQTCRRPVKGKDEDGVKWRWTKMATKNWPMDLAVWRHKWPWQEWFWVEWREERPDWRELTRRGERQLHPWTMTSNLADLVWVPSYAPCQPWRGRLNSLTSLPSVSQTNAKIHLIFFFFK